VQPLVLDAFLDEVLLDFDVVEVMRGLEVVSLLAVLEGAGLVVVLFAHVASWISSDRQTVRRSYSTRPPL
jgi:hypothetical protein